MFRFDLDSNLGLVTIVEPIGWDSRKPAIERNDTYHGLFTSFTVNLTFHNGNVDFISSEIPESIARGKAFNYLEELFQSDGIQAECTILFYEWSNLTKDWILQDTGVIDFKTRNVVSTIRGGGVEYAILETDFKQKMKSREDILINYNSSETLDGEPITPPVYFDCEIKGMPIADSGIESIITDNTYPDNCVCAVANDYDNPLFQNVLGRTQSILVFIESDCWYYTKTGGNVTFDIDITYNHGSNSGLATDYFNQLLVYGVNFDGGGYTLTTLVDEQNNSDGTFNYTNTITTSLEESSGIVIAFVHYAKTILGVDVDSRISISDSNLTTSFIDSFEPTSSKVIFPYEAFTQMKEAITGDTTPIDAEIFNRPDTSDPSVGYGEYSLYSLMNGLLIRNFEEDEANLSFSWKGLFESLNKIFNIGIGITNGVVEIKKRRDFYLDDIVHTFEKEDVVADSTEKSLALDWFYSDAQVGYSKGAYEEISGLLEYNNESSWNTYLSKINNKIEAISELRGDGFGIEFARRLQKIADTKNNNTTDSDYDEDNFIMDTVVVNNDYVQRDKEGFDEVLLNGSEVSSPLMNLSITPAQIIRNHGWLLLTGLQKNADKIIKFNKSANVVDLQTTTSGVTVKESADIQYNELDEPLFTGHLIEMEVRASLSIYNKIKTNPYGLIKVWNEVEEQYNYGWIKSFSVESVDKSTNLTLIEAKSVSELLNPWLWNDGEEILWNTGDFIALNS